VASLENAAVECPGGETLFVLEVYFHDLLKTRPSYLVCVVMELSHISPVVM
jgi:hypothetical protein